MPSDVAREPGQFCGARLDVLRPHRDPQLRHRIGGELDSRHGQLDLPLARVLSEQRYLAEGVSLRSWLGRGSSVGQVREDNVLVTFRRITVRPDQMGGVPCIRGLRIPVATVVGMIADGMPEAEVLEAYPDLEAEDIREALRYAAEAVRERELPLTVGE